MKSIILRILPILIFVGFFSSCISNKKIIYMQDQGKENPLIESSPKIPYQFEDYLLQYYDIVDISIRTANNELNELFNVNAGMMQNMGMMGGGGMAGGDIFFMNGYTIDESGKVELPLIGEISFVGLTTKQAKEKIEEQVKRFVNDDEYFVRVRLGGIRFSALGEFNTPGKITILQNRVTIFEAIAAANDLNIIAKRDELVLVRQYPDGSQIHRIDLNNRNLLSSDFYFIRPNDVLYAEPLRVRELGNTTNFIQTLTLLTSTITAVALIVTILR